MIDLSYYKFMIVRFYVCLSFLASLFLSSCSLANDVIPPESSYVRQQGQQILDSQGKPFYIKGINLGGGFLWEAWMFGGGILASETLLFDRLSRDDLLGSQGARLFREKIDSEWTSEEDIKRIKELGFNTVRIPFNHTLIEDPNRIRHLDQIIEWCEAFDLYIILDLHAAPRSQNTVGLISDWNWGEKSMWDWEVWEETKAMTRDLWQTIALRYRDNTQILGYDLLNEPDTSLLGLSPFNRHMLPEIYASIIEGIREVDPYHMVILEGDNFAADFSRLCRPLDTNMAYQFHIYSWTLQGQSYEDDLRAWLDIAQDQNVPIFAGEFGVDTLEEIEKQMNAFQVFADQLSGWMLWSWKSTDNQEGEWNGKLSKDIQHSIREVTITPEWQKLITYAGDGFAEKPSSTDIQQGFNSFMSNMLFTNTHENKPLIGILFPDAPDE